VAVTNATSALHIACLAAGLAPGDRLWTSPNTFVASANCARYCGADVDFVDIDPSTGCMDVVALEAKLDSADAAVPSITSAWPSANFYEREVFDLFGIDFPGHPRLTRIMMPTDWQGHPLRKDYPVEGYR